VKSSDNYKLEMEKLERFLEEANSSQVNDKSSFLLPALRKSQELFRSIPEFVQNVIASEFSIDLEDILKVINAYPYLTEGTVADKRVSICCGPVCYRKGAMDVHDELRERLCLGGECDTTDDNKVSVKMTHCKGNCRQAPMATINTKPYYRIEKDKFCDIVKEQTQ